MACRKRSSHAIDRGDERHDVGGMMRERRPDILAQRRDWLPGQLDLEPKRLVFIDEPWTATNMTCSHSRFPRGERLRMGYPHGHRKTTTLVAGLRLIDMVATMVFDGPINGDWFEVYATQELVLELEHGDVVVLSTSLRTGMDNPSGHKHISLRERIESASAALMFFPILIPSKRYRVASRSCSRESFSTP